MYPSKSAVSWITRRGAASPIINLRNWGTSPTTKPTIWKFSQYWIVCLGIHKLIIAWFVWKMTSRLTWFTSLVLPVLLVFTGIQLASDSFSKILCLSSNKHIWLLPTWLHLIRESGIGSIPQNCSSILEQRCARTCYVNVPSKDKISITKTMNHMIFES